MTLVKEYPVLLDYLPKSRIRIIALLKEALEVWTKALPYRYRNFKERSCHLCDYHVARYEAWPCGIHQCSCGRWHTICLGCTITKKLTEVATNFGLLVVCPLQLKPALILSGDYRRANAAQRRSDGQLD